MKRYTTVWKSTSDESAGTASFVHSMNELAQAVWRVISSGYNTPNFFYSGCWWAIMERDTDA